MGFGVVRVVRTGRRVTWRIPVTVHSQSVHGYLLRWPRESDAGERRQMHDQKLAAHIHMGLIEHSKRLVHLPSTKNPRELFQHIQTSKTVSWMPPRRNACSHLRRRMRGLQHGNTRAEVQTSS